MGTLRWRQNGRYSVSNHQPHDCLLNRLFRRRSKKTSKLRVIGLCARNSPGTGEFPAQMASYAENVSIWWRHHGSFLNCWKFVGVISGHWWILLIMGHICKASVLGKQSRCRGLETPQLYMNTCVIYKMTIYYIVLHSFLFMPKPNKNILIRFSSYAQVYMGHV